VSDPDLDPLDADLADLFAAERSRPAPLPDARARVMARVNATLGPGGGGGGPPAPPPGGAALLKPILIGLALGGALVAGVAVRDGSAPLPAPAPVVTALAPDPGAAPPPAPETPPLPASAAPPRPSAEASASSHRDDSLTAERSILDEANRALSAGRSAAAFEALERHAETFPRGRLSEEREGLWLRALIAAGRLDEARARAARFKRLYPHSMLLPALDAALGTIP
jgi:hypothetical protein